MTMETDNKPTPDTGEKAPAPANDAPEPTETDTAATEPQPNRNRQTRRRQRLRRLPPQTFSISSAPQRNAATAKALTKPREKTSAPQTGFGARRKPAVMRTTTTPAPKY